MSTALTISAATAKLQWSFTKTQTWGDTTNSSNFSYTARLTDGTALNQANRLYVSAGTIAASTNLDLDLAASLVDVFGATITFARIKVIYIELQTTTTATHLFVGGHPTAGFTNWITSAGTFGTDQPKVTVRNGGCLFLCAPDATGYVVTATTADILRLTNADSTNTATYRVALVGASA
jgi:hypothetical protein